MNFLSKLLIQFVRIFAWDEAATKDLSEAEVLSSLEKVESLAAMNQKLKDEEEAVAKLKGEVATLTSLNETNQGKIKDLQDENVKIQNQIKTDAEANKKVVEDLKEEINKLKIGESAGDPGAGGTITKGQATDKKVVKMSWDVPKTMTK